MGEVVSETQATYWRHKNVLVTGCTGLLGSWLTERLVGEGANVVGLVRDLVPNTNLNRAGLAARINVVHGSVEDYAVVLRALNEYEIDTCFHLAAQTIVTIANREPLSTFESNIKGTWTVLEALRHTPTIRRIVVASSDKAYGDQPELPYREDAPLQGRHPYDVSKSCTDLIARSYFVTYGLPLAISRCGNLYGGGDLNFSRIVPGTIRSILHGERPVIRSDGSPRRDYLYVKEAVNCYLALAAGLDREEIRGEAFNFGPETPLSVLELVQKIIAASGVTGLEADVRGQGVLTGEIQDQFLCQEKALELLHWSREYDLDQGLRETLDWYRNFFRDLEQRRGKHADPVERPPGPRHRGGRLHRLASRPAADGGGGHGPRAGHRRR